ncbi:SpoIIE family protein phosphatase [Streptomyces sp. NPDC001833]|uniref:SpoIIE family protein phosphatase n=1 Tax=Streptomyces sp. NPDC001833 TaxID=3154658 RepID=UPI0033242EDF
MSVPHLHPAPPLGIALTDPADHLLDTVPFAAEDTLLLYTDGVIEARDRNGTFCPLPDRAARWAGSDPDALLRHLRHDLMARTG